MELHTTLLTFYGIFLIVCGIAAVTFIGMKAKTALMSGGMSGAMALLLAWLVSDDIASGRLGGIGLTLLLFCVFSWRSAKTLFKIFDLLQTPALTDLKGKGIAFLIISLMAVVSLMVLLLQLLICAGGV